MKSKDRATLYIATNSTGTHKVPLAMLGNCNNPYCMGQDNRESMVRHKNIQKMLFGGFLMRVH